MSFIKNLPIDIINYMLPFLDLISGYTIAVEMHDYGVKFLSIPCRPSTKHLIIEKICSEYKDLWYLEKNMLILDIAENCTELQSCKIFDILMKSSYGFIHGMHIPNENVLKYIIRLIVKYDDSFSLDLLISYLEQKKLYIEFRKRFTYLGTIYEDESGVLLQVACNENIVKCPSLINHLKYNYAQIFSGSKLIKKIMGGLQLSSKYYAALYKICNYYDYGNDYGENFHITGTPQITYFKILYKRHTNFSMDA